MHKTSLVEVAGIRRVRLTRLPLAAAVCMAIALPAFAQGAGQSATPSAEQETGTQTANLKTKTLGTVIVTAQRRTENIQAVPISISVLGSVQLQQLHVQAFKDYVQYLPSVSFQEGGGGIATGPGFAQIYMRGVTTGGNANHSGSEPTVAVYLDDQPVTTIQGPLDIHMYDIDRVEVLSGPQGTLFGASAEAGALRIITNKPDPSGFAANYTVDTNQVDHGGIGYTYEGMLNAPLHLPVVKDAAIRLVAWHQHDAGYIDNKPGSVIFPTSGITISNAPGCVPTDNNAPSAKFQCIGHARNNYNDVTTQGARTALKVDLNDNWSITPTLMGQQTISHGNFASDPVVGKLAVNRFYPERVDDRWWQGALTVQGKIGNFDVTNTYTHLKRVQEEQTDYTDYGFWYDTMFGSGAYWFDNAGDLINPAQHINDRDRYTDDSEEFHIASPSTDRLRVLAGFFWQRDRHDIYQRYMVDGMANSLIVPGLPDTEWLTNQKRFDRHKAVYANLTYDFIPDVFSGTVGRRYYREANSLGGFYGYGGQFPDSTSNGLANCQTHVPYNADSSFLPAPCRSFQKSVKSSGSIGLYNLTWHITPTQMIYVTRSKGFRPGGVNRFGSLPPYQPDFLVNTEFGWKTSWLDNHLTWNGAVFHDKWENFQFNILFPPGLTVINNAGAASIDGLESQLDWQATYNLTLVAGVAYYKAKLTEAYCGFTDPNGNPVTNCPAGTINSLTGKAVSGPQAPIGTQLPITPRFKGNLIARYAFNLGGNDAFVQAAFVHVGERTTDLRLLERGLLGNLPSYNTLDLSAGIHHDNWSLNVYANNVFDKLGSLYKYSECLPGTCAVHNLAPKYPDGQVYTGFTQPRTIGVRFKQDFD